ncbi:MAG TPA: MFS transporter [Burkholderiales bacterium]|jgi:DHA1 family bicyclomycin/chloramphenicol resistance-like MFS transporter|nr:MFS transporter [Burkholderiales bacterium]
MPDPAANASPAPAPATPPAGRSPPAISIAWLAFAGASSPYGFNFIGPVLPALQQAFALEGAQVQWLVSSYSLTLGLGQLVMGPLSDAWGRRGVLLTGLALTIVGSVGAMLSHSFALILLFRLVQGFGACTALVVPRAVIRDLYTKSEDIARGIAIVTITLSVAPAIAPLIAGALLAWFDWRSGFASCAVLGIVSLALALRHHAETLAQEKRAPMRAGALLRAYIEIGRAPRFFAYTASYALLNAGVIIFLVIAPGAFAHQYGLRPWDAAVGILILYAGSAAANLYAVRHIRRTGANRMLAVGLAVGVASALALAASSYFTSSLVVAMVLMFINSLGNGFGFPSGIAGAVGLHPTRAGTAAALVGATQLCISSLVAVAAGVLADGTLRPLVWLVLLTALLALLAALPVYRKPRA